MVDRIIIRSEIWEGEDIWTLARPVNAAGVVIYSGDVTAIELKLFDRSASFTDSTGPSVAIVTDSTGAADFNVAELMETELQTGAEWDVDDIGYSFKHQLTAAHITSEVNDGNDYPMGGHRYLLEYKLTVTSYGTLWIIHEIYCKPVASA